jgi:hypothetical protein
MQSIFIGLMTFFTSLAVWANLTFPIPVNTVFVPEGFDSNDTVEVYVKGYLPSLCYQNPEFKVQRVVKNNIFIEVEARINSIPGMACPEVIVPYEMPIRLGQLKSGKYNLVFNYQTPYKKVIQVRVDRALSAQIDDYLYALVEDVQYLDNGLLEISGYNPSSCFALDKVEIYHNHKDTYSILPKLKMVSSICPSVLVPFKYRIRFKHVLSEQEVLLHIRTMNGHALNKVLTILPQRYRRYR